MLWASSVESALRAEYAGAVGSLSPGSDCCGIVIEDCMERYSLAYGGADAVDSVEMGCSAAGDGCSCWSDA